MKFNLVIMAASILLLGACSNEVEDVKANTKKSTEQTNVVEKSSENEAPESELVTNIKVENISDIAEYFALYGYETTFH